MWWLSPRVPYADAWRFLGHFLQAPFPYDILAPDNGHHELLPNAVRVLELHAFAAQQWLQVVVGLVLALAPVLVFARRAEEHTSELQSLMRHSYAVFCLKKKQ